MYEIANVGNLSFEAGLPYDGWEGFLIEPQGLQGWHGIGVRRDTKERPGAHGSFSTAGMLTDRMVTLQGHVIAESWDKLAHLCQELTSLDVGAQHRLSVQEDISTKWADAYVAGVTVQPFSGDGDFIAEFTLDLWCPEPFKYGAQHKFAGKIGTAFYVHNRGNAPAFPVLRVFGQVNNGWKIRIGDRMMTAKFHVNAGTSWRIHTRTGRVFDPPTGRELVDGRVVGEMPFIPPGGQIYLHFIGSGTGGRIEVTSYDTYV